MPKGGEQHVAVAELVDAEDVGVGNQVEGELVTAAVVLEDLEKIAADGVFGKGGIRFLDTDGKPTSRPE